MTSLATTFSFGPLLLYEVAQPRLRRVVQLMFGLPIFGFALGISVKAELGLNPWTVFHDGLSAHTPLTIGTATIVTGLVLLLVFPLVGEPMGLGTLLNVTLVGLFVDLTIAVVPDPSSMTARVLLLAASPVLLGVGSGFYIGAGLGPGPRDGLMTAIERRGLPVWLARTMIEVTALVVGAILGGDVGIGTLWIAGTVGLFVHFFLTRLRIKPTEATD